MTLNSAEVAEEFSVSRMSGNEELAARVAPNDRLPARRGQPRHTVDGLGSGSRGCGATAQDSCTSTQAHRELRRLLSPMEHCPRLVSRPIRSSRYVRWTLTSEVSDRWMASNSLRSQFWQGNGRARACIDGQCLGTIHLQGTAGSMLKSTGRRIWPRSRRGKCSRSTGQCVQ